MISLFDDLSLSRPWEGVLREEEGEEEDRSSKNRFNLKLRSDFWTGLWTLECLRSSILVRPSRPQHRTGDYIEGEPWFP